MTTWRNTSSINNIWLPRRRAGNILARVATRGRFNSNPVSRLLRCIRIYSSRWCSSRKSLCSSSMQNHKARDTWSLGHRVRLAAWTHTDDRATCRQAWSVHIRPHRIAITIRSTSWRSKAAGSAYTQATRAKAMVAAGNCTIWVSLKQRTTNKVLHIRKPCTSKCSKTNRRTTRQCTDSNSKCIGTPNSSSIVCTQVSRPTVDTIRTTPSKFLRSLSSHPLDEIEQLNSLKCVE